MRWICSDTAAARLLALTSSAMWPPEHGEPGRRVLRLSSPVARSAIRHSRRWVSHYDGLNAPAPGSPTPGPRGTGEAAAGLPMSSHVLTASDYLAWWRRRARVRTPTRSSMFTSVAGRRSRGRRRGSPRISKRGIPFANALKGRGHGQLSSVSTVSQLRRFTFDCPPTGSSGLRP